MRDLIIIAGEYPATDEPGADMPDITPPEDVARLLVSQMPVPLDKAAPGPERSLACGVAQAVQHHASSIDIVSLGNPGAHLKRNWDPTHSGRLYAKSVRRLIRLLERGEYRVAGLLWVARAPAPDRQDAFRHLFVSLIEKLRIAIGAPNLPVCATTFESDRPDGLDEYISGISIPNYVYVPPDTTKPATLANCGAALGKALYSQDYEKPEAFRRQITWLWKGDMYEAWLSQPPETAADNLNYVVVLPHAAGADTHGFEIPGFGQTAIESRGYKAVFIRSRQSNWFQDEEILQAAIAIRDALPKNTRITTYGASMGGYGALLLSSPLNAERVIAVAPQFSLDQSVVPFERRWRVHRDRIGGFCHDLSEMIAPEAQKIVLFDNLDNDRHHIALIEPDSSFQLYRFSGASHQILRFLKETGCLSDFLTMIGDIDMSFDDSFARSRQRRGQSPIYWLSVFRHFKRHRPDWAAAALVKCIEIEGPKHKYRKRLRKLGYKWRNPATLNDPLHDGTSTAA